MVVARLDSAVGAPMHGFSHLNAQKHALTFLLITLVLLNIFQCRFLLIIQQNDSKQFLEELKF